MPPTLEERVEALERQVRALTEAVVQNTPARDWRAAIGWARNDEGYGEMARLGAEIRKADRDASGEG